MSKWSKCIETNGCIPIWSTRKARNVHDTGELQFPPFVTFHFHALEREVATHSSVLAWRIPGTGEPGGLLSMGSHRVGHDWNNLAAVAALFFWLHLKACGILVPWPEMEPVPPAAEVWSPNHWTTRDFPEENCSCSTMQPTSPHPPRSPGSLLQSLLLLGPLLSHCWS